MNVRNLLIIIALALPVAAIVLIASRSPEVPIAEAPQVRKLEPGGISTAPRRLPPTDLKARPRRGGPPKPLSLDEAKNRVKEELERLQRLSPEEWEAEQRQRIERGMPLPPPPGGGEPPPDADQQQELPAPQKDDERN